MSDLIKRLRNREDIETMFDNLGNEAADEIERLQKQVALAREALALVSKAAPNELDCDQLHHTKGDRHECYEDCKPHSRYITSIRKVNKALAAIGDKT